MTLGGGGGKGGGKGLTMMITLISTHAAPPPRNTKHTHSDASTSTAMASKRGGEGGRGVCGDVATRSLASFSVVGPARRTRTSSLHRQKEKGKRSGAHQPTQQGGGSLAPERICFFFFFVLAHSSTALFALPRTPLSPSLAMRTARAVARLAAALRSDAGRRGVG